jgi:succinyl-diaminopimelate desuccinylase
MEEIFKKIESFREDMVFLQKELTARPAIGPENGGKGEMEKAIFLKGFIKEIGLNYEEYNAFDERINGERPNLRVNLSGEDESKTFWIITHLDVVPAGNLSLWQSDPFSAVVKDGKIYGRGTEDNQQEMVASLFALKALKDLNKKPTCTVSLLFVADEETGSRFGMGYLLNNFSLFRKEDLILVPDAGNRDGSLIEIAEKTILWLKFLVKGKQTHASTPDDGLNAHRLGARFLLLLDKELHRRFKKRNRLFNPPFSTFEPTKKEANCPNINTIPGEDVFYFDCRLLPEYHPDEITGFIEELKEDFQKRYGGEISYEVVMMGEVAPQTPPNVEVVKRLRKAIKMVYPINPKLGGIGGGTVAALLRKRGFPCCVWGKNEGQAHQANEYCLIDNMVNDCKVYTAYALL